MIYHIIAAETGKELADGVNTLIEEGLVPLGGVSVVVSGGKVRWAQAMVNYEDEKIREAQTAWVEIVNIAKERSDAEQS